MNKLGETGDNLGFSQNEKQMNSKKATLRGVKFSNPVDPKKATQVRPLIPPSEDIQKKTPINSKKATLMPSRRLMSYQNFETEKVHDIQEKQLNPGLIPAKEKIPLSESELEFDVTAYLKTLPLYEKEINHEGLPNTLAYLVSGRQKSQFLKIITEINKNSEFQIQLKKDELGNIMFCHTRFEARTLIRLHPNLKPYLSNSKNTLCFGEGKKINFTDKGMSFERNAKLNSLYSKLQKDYGSLPHLNIPEMNLAPLDDFSGSQKEIQSIFTCALANSRGIVIAESTHADKMAKLTLIDQMPNLAEQGVKTLFLEFCCFDTIQEQLDDFYKTGNASAFLKEFLTHGCGGAAGENNFYDLVEAAVKANIRPVGLEHSAAQDIGFDKREGSRGAERMIGLNVVGKNIIDHEAGEAKYVVFVGAAHASGASDIAGFSKLCGIPSIVIEDKEKNNSPLCQLNASVFDSDPNDIVLTI